MLEGLILPGRSEASGAKVKHRQVWAGPQPWKVKEGDLEALSSAKGQKQEQRGEWVD